MIKYIVILKKSSKFMGEVNAIVVASIPILPKYLSSLLYVTVNSFLSFISALLLSQPTD